MSAGDWPEIGRSETVRQPMNCRRDDGVILVLALLLTLMLSVLGVAFALVTSSEAVIAENFRNDQEALHADLVALWSAHNHSSLANRTAVDAEYLEVVAIRSTQ